MCTQVSSYHGSHHDVLFVSTRVHHEVSVIGLQKITANIKRTNRAAVQQFQIS